MKIFRNNKMEHLPIFSGNPSYNKEITINYYNTGKLNTITTRTYKMKSTIIIRIKISLKCSYK